MLRMNIVKNNVAVFSLEFERTKRQNFELECENGGKRDWCEEATVDGNGPVVETLAQDRSPLDREVQHERSDARGLQKGLQTSVVSGLPLVRSGEGQHGLVRTQNDSKFTDGRTWCRRRSPSSPEMPMVLRSQSKCPWVGSNLLKIAGVGDSLQNLERARSWCSLCGCETKIHKMPRGPKCVRHAGGTLLVDGVDC